MIVIGGSSHPTLSERVATTLGCEFIRSNTGQFADRELKVWIDKDLYEQEVIIMQSTSRPANDHLMELLLLVDTAKRAGCRKITAVMPYIGYSRQDKLSYPYGPISSSLVANLIETSGVDKVIAIDLHSKQSEEFFKKGVTNLDPSDLFVAEFKNKKHYVVVSPDGGGLSRARIFAEKLGTDLVMINKGRNLEGECTMSKMIGTVTGKDCIIVDDIVDTGGTLCKAAHLLMERGAKSVSACITHAVFSNDCIKKVEQVGFDAFFVTDTIYHRQLPPFIRILFTQGMIAQAVCNDNQV